MIVCYHTQITQPWTDAELQQKAAGIPQAIMQKILQKRNHLDVQLSVTGNLLLAKLIKHFKLDVTLDDIVYNAYQRPCFNTGVDFNIAHAGNRVICCATSHGKVGTDIELIKPININHGDYFTAAEQQSIRTATNPGTAFFKYWTRKEAVLKAIGTGLYTPLLDIDLSADEISYQGEKYYLSPIDIAPDYKGCIAYTVSQDIVIYPL
jgi:4'-phosphopantetheinyl transferase